MKRRRRQPWTSRARTLGQLDDFDPGISSQPITEVQDFESLPSSIPVATVIGLRPSVFSTKPTLDAAGGDPGDDVEDEDPGDQPSDDDKAKDENGFPVVPVVVGVAAVVALGIAIAVAS